VALPCCVFVEPFFATTENQVVGHVSQFPLEVDPPLNVPFLGEIEFEKVIVAVELY
jgi:hypothetical protein